MLTYSCSQFGVRTACRVKTKLKDSHFPVSKLPKMLSNQVSTVLTCRQVIGEWNRIRILEISHTSMVNWLLTRLPKLFHGERIVFNKWAGWPQAKDVARPLLHTMYKNQLQMNQHLNIRAESTFLTGKHRINLHKLGFGKGFLDMTPKA